MGWPRWGVGTVAAQASVEVWEVEGRLCSWSTELQPAVQSLACHVDYAVVPLLIFKMVLLEHGRVFLDSVSSKTFFFFKICLFSGIGYFVYLPCNTYTADTVTSWKGDLSCSATSLIHCLLLLFAFVTVQEACFRFWIISLLCKLSLWKRENFGLWSSVFIWINQFLRN